VIKAALPESLPRSPRVLLMTCTSARAAALVIWSIYRGEVGRGMDHVIAFGLEIDAMPISIALSELVYGVDLGYIGQSSV
jgi:hypothetical protein